MRKALILLMSVLILAIYAHAPSTIELTFDVKTEILDVTVIHPVGNVEKHYVEKIEVFIDDEMVIVQTFKRQMNNREQKASYLLFEAEENSKIKVVAHCSIHGSLSEETTVGN